MGVEEGTPRNLPWFKIQDQLWVVAALALAQDELGRWEASKLVRNLGLFETPQTVRRMLWMNFLYEQILDVPGVMHQYGVQWGRDLILWECLREIHEPAARGQERRIVGFDTFTGHVGTDPVDGDFEYVTEGSFAVPDGYPQALLNYMNNRRHVQPNPGTNLVIGDVRETIPAYLNQFPQEVIALAYLDLDLYQPTKIAIEHLLDRMLPGSVIALDEFATAAYPGEALAALQTITGKRIQKSPLGDWCWIRL